MTVAGKTREPEVGLTHRSRVGRRRVDRRDHPRYSGCLAVASKCSCGSQKPLRQTGSIQPGPVVIYGNEPTPRGCSDGVSRRPGGRPMPGWRAGFTRAGGRSSWRTRCGCEDRPGFGSQSRTVKRQNGPTAGGRQAPSAVAIAVGLINLTLRGIPTLCTCMQAQSQRVSRIEIHLRGVDPETWFRFRIEQ